MTSSPRSGLLAVHAHPDDETLATGGLLATWAAAGQPVTLVTCTRGEGGEVIPPGLGALEGDGPALAVHREGELAEAMRRLGVTDHLLLDTVPGAPADAPGSGVEGSGAAGRRFEDSGMAWLGAGRAGAPERVPDGAFVAVPLDDAASRLARVIRDRRPDVVVTYEPGGGYGHPDHVHAHRVAMRAVELAAGPGPEGEPAHEVAVVLWAAVPDRVLRAARAVLGDHPAVRGVRAARPSLSLPDPAGPLPAVAVAPDAVGIRVDTAPVVARVADALRAHGTQVGSVALGEAVQIAPGVAVVGCYALSDDVLAPLLDAEHYRLAPGRTRSGGRPVWPAAVGPVA